MEKVEQTFRSMDEILAEMEALDLKKQAKFWTE